MTAMWDMEDGNPGQLATQLQDVREPAFATAVAVSSKPRARSASAAAPLPRQHETQAHAEDVAPDDEPAAARQRVDARLDALLALDDGGVATAMRAGVMSPGKRIRPLMMLALARDFDCATPALLDMACAIEMVHAASLILDDLPCMDDAALRRGQPTIHRQFGEDVATLAAVGLLSQAFQTVARAPGLAGTSRAQAVVIMADAVGLAGLVGGQYQDLHDGKGPRHARNIAMTNHLKTGALFEAAFGLCAVCADADDAIRGRLAALAAELGQAFQLLDDLHDCAAVHIDDKDVGRDADKSTLVQAWGQAEALRRLQGHTDEVQRHAHLLGARRLGRQLAAVFAMAVRSDTAQAA